MKSSTRRQRASAESPLDAASLGRLFDALHAGLYVGYLTGDRTVTIAANPQLRVMFGWEANVPVTEVRPFDADGFVDEQARRDFLQRLARDGSVRDYVLRMRRANGSAFWVEITARAEGAPNTETWRIDALVRDVTEQRKLDEQAREQHHQIAQTERITAAETLVSRVAHELNNPLNTILACAERLFGQALDPRTRKDIDSMHNAAERATRIVRELQLSHKRHTTRTTVDLNEIMRETLLIRAQKQRSANIVILEALAAGLPHVFADQFQIQQVLLNLLINAEDATLEAHGRGTLILRSWHDPERDAVILEVHDDGPGVPADIQPKIFDPLFTTKDVGKGTGMGLYVAYTIAQQHGGQLRVASPPGGGASFCLELPVSGPHVRTPDTFTSTEKLPDVPKGTRALVIEDEQALNEAVAASLTDAGFQVDRAVDGEQALAHLAERLYDVVICDLRMPKMNGEAFFRRISATMPSMARRIIFVTGDVAGTDAERFLQDSGCRWVPKPFRLRELVRIARETLQ